MRHSRKKKTYTHEEGIQNSSATMALTSTLHMKLELNYLITYLYV